MGIKQTPTTRHGVFVCFSLFACWHFCSLSLFLSLSFSISSFCFISANAPDENRESRIKNRQAVWHSPNAATFYIDVCASSAPMRSKTIDFHFIFFCDFLLVVSSSAWHYVSGSRAAFMKPIAGALKICPVTRCV